MRREGPPTPFIAPAGVRTVFLAGSIEMGIAEHWQRRLAHACADRDVIVLDPRRDDWDASWRQSIDDAKNTPATQRA